MGLGAEHPRTNLCLVHGQGLGAWRDKIERDYNSLTVLIFLLIF